MPRSTSCNKHKSQPTKYYPFQSEVVLNIPRNFARVSLISLLLRNRVLYSMNNMRHGFIVETCGAKDQNLNLNKIRLVFIVLFNELCMA